MSRENSGRNSGEGSTPVGIGDALRGIRGGSRTKVKIAVGGIGGGPDEIVRVTYADGTHGEMGIRELRARHPDVLLVRVLGA